MATAAYPVSASRFRLSAAGRRPAAIAANIALLVVAVAFLIPMVWLFLAAINPSAQLSASIPSHPGLGNFRAVLTTAITFRPMWNGLVLCGGAAILTVIVATLAAYPLSRYQLRFKRTFLYVILFSTGLPLTAVMVPVYGLFVRLNLLDSMSGTIVFMAATQLPFAIWLIKGFMDSVPIDIEEAAWCDGASAMQSLRRVVLPLMAPGMGVVAIFTFILGWGNFFVPFILLLSPSKQPAAVSIYTFFGQYGSVAYGQLAAYSILYSAPVVILYVFVSRVLGGAFNLAGGLKG